MEYTKLCKLRDLLTEYMDERKILDDDQYYIIDDIIEDIETKQVMDNKRLDQYLSR